MIIHKTTGMGCTDLSNPTPGVAFYRFAQCGKTEEKLARLEQMIGSLHRPNLNPKQLSLAIAIIISKL